MRKIIYILYRYYSDGLTNSAAYYKSIFIILFLLFINIFTLVLMLNLDDVLNLLKGTEKMTQYLIFFICYLVPGYLILSRAVKMNDLKNIDLENNYKKQHGWFLVLYIVFSILLLVASMIYNISK